MGRRWRTQHEPRVLDHDDKDHERHGQRHGRQVHRLANQSTMQLYQIEATISRTCYMAITTSKTGEAGQQCLLYLVHADCSVYHTWCI